MVEIEGERVLAPSCCRCPTEGMKVTSTSERATKSQKMVAELLLTDMPGQTARCTSSHPSSTCGPASSASRAPRFPQRHEPAPDLSHPAMSVNLDACIQCGRCVRACREEQVNDVIGYAWRGEHAKIVFDFDDPMGTSSCVACGECVQACPTGALAPANGVAMIEPDATGRLGVPVLRRGLSAHVQHQGRQDHLRRRARRPGEREPAVRQGPLRLRLRPQPQLTIVRT